MPRDVAGTYTAPAGTLADPLEQIQSSRFNSFVGDVEDEMNSARPIVAGGTGSTTADAAAAALGLISAKDLAGTGTTGGTANAITLATDREYEELAGTILIAFKATTDNSGATTFKLDDLEVKDIRKVAATGDVAVNSGDILAGGVYLLKYDPEAKEDVGAWIILNPSPTGGYQVGDYLDTARTLSSDWLRRNGALYNISAYPELSALLPAMANGIDWAVRTSDTPDPLICVIYGEGQYFAAGGKSIVSSTTGMSWSLRYTVEGSSFFYDLAAGNNILVAADIGEGYTYVSTDGNDWTTDETAHAATIYSVCFNTEASEFVICGAGGYIGTGADGVSFSSQTSGVSTVLRRVRCLNGLLIAVGASGVILTSVDDGVTWVARTSGVATALYDVTYYDGTYVVVGASGVILTSTTLGTWTARTSGVASDLYTVTASSSGFLAAGTGGVVRISSDAVTWAASATGVTVLLAGSIVDPTNAARYIVAGQSNTILDGLRTASTQFRVPNDNPTNGWIKAVS